MHSLLEVYVFLSLSPSPPPPPPPQDSEKESGEGDEEISLEDALNASVEIGAPVCQAGGGGAESRV